MVVGDQSPRIGNFPYDVQKKVAYAAYLEFVYFQMSTGTQIIPVVDIVAQTKSVKAFASVKKNQVTRMAYNSSDINVAIADAIEKLRKLYTSNVYAKMVDSGFVAQGTPIGIAYYYVVMEQEN